MPPVGNGLPGTPIPSRTRKGNKIVHGRKNHGSKSGGNHRAKGCV
jgi:hypothetical protein